MENKPHATILVANGGYVLEWLDRVEDSYNVSVFTTLDQLIGGVRRVIPQLEGPDEPIVRLGNLKIDE